MRTRSKIFMLTTVIATATLALVGTAQAQEQGRVISSQAVVQQVAVPRQVCGTQQVAVQGQKSGAGGLMGAIAGGAIGNNVGGGAGRGLATVVGIVGGAIAGDHVEGTPPVQMQTVQNCTTQTFYENRTTAYNVVYEYNGKQYNVQMPNDPGQFVQLQVTPAGSSQPAPMMQQQPPVVQQVVAPQVVYAAQPQVVYAQPYYYPSYYGGIYPAVNIGFGFGFRGGYGRRW